MDYNCDGSIGYADADGDGAPACEDCDDGDGGRSPLLDEVCDELDVDEDCDGLSDDDDASVTGTTTWYVDADGDSYGGTTSVQACESVSGYVSHDDDCNDTNASISPARTEVCDSADTDEDCDGAADDADGNASVTTSACDTPRGYVSNDDDCDDTSSSIGINHTWYHDADGDRYGVSTTTSGSCTQPSGYVSNDDDCNDTSTSISPVATEVCDSANTDEDSDGAADDSDTSATGKSTR